MLLAFALAQHHSARVDLNNLAFIFGRERGANVVASLNELDCLDPASRDVGMPVCGGLVPIFISPAYACTYSCEHAQVQASVHMHAA